MQLLLTYKAQKQLDKIPHPYFLKIREKINILAADPFPSGAVKLVGEVGFRLRVADYRILYWVDTKAKTVIIVRVAHRREAYHQ